MNIFGKLPEAQACTDDVIGVRATLPKKADFWEALVALPNLVLLELVTGTKYGEIPDLLAQAPYLRYLTINGQAYYTDDLTPLPSVIWKLPHLETLYISNAEQTEWEDCDWSGLVSLRELTIIRAGKSFPRGIFALPRLEKLHLGGTEGWQYPLRGWDRLQQLKHFTSDNTRIGKIEMGDKPALETISICIKKHWPLWLGTLQAPKLRSLRLIGSNYTTASISSSIFRFTGLESLELFCLGLTELDPKIGQLKQLRSLHVESNRLETLPEELVELPLERLVLRNNPFNWLPGILLRLMPRLKELDRHGLVVHTSTQRQFDCIAEKLEAIQADAALRARMADLWDGILPEQLDLKTLEIALSMGVSDIDTQLFLWLTEHSAQAYRPLQKGDKIAVAAKVLGKRTDIKTKLKKEGIEAVFLKKGEQPAAGTTHLLLGKDCLLPPGDWFGAFSFCLMTEVQLNAFLNEKQPDFLRQDSNEHENSEMVQRVKELIHSMDLANIGVALSLLKSGGVPEDCKDELFVVYKLVMDYDLRSEAGKLLKTVASEALQAALKKRVLFQGKCFYDYKEVANALSVFDGTELNMGYFARMFHWLYRYPGGSRDILYYLLRSDYSEELRLFFNDQLDEKGHLSVGFGYDGIGSVPVELFQVQNMRSLELYFYGKSSEMNVEEILRPELVAMPKLRKLYLRVYANNEPFFKTIKQLEPLTRMTKLKQLHIILEEGKLRAELQTKMPHCKLK